MVVSTAAALLVGLISGALIGKDRFLEAGERVTGGLRDLWRNLTSAMQQAAAGAVEAPEGDEEAPTPEVVPRITDFLDTYAEPAVDVHPETVTSKVWLWMMGEANRREREQRRRQALACDGYSEDEIDQIIEGTFYVTSSQVANGALAQSLVLRMRLARWGTESAAAALEKVGASFQWLQDQGGDAALKERERELRSIHGFLSRHDVDSTREPKVATQPSTLAALVRSRPSGLQKEYAGVAAIGRLRGARKVYRRYEQARRLQAAMAPKAKQRRVGLMGVASLGLPPTRSGPPPHGADADAEARQEAVLTPSSKRGAISRRSGGHSSRRSTGDEEDESDWAPLSSHRSEGPGRLRRRSGSPFSTARSQRSDLSTARSCSCSFDDDYGGDDGQEEEDEIDDTSSPPPSPPAALETRTWYKISASHKHHTA
jgi:Flp pilus assembly pilin Flp